MGKGATIESVTNVLGGVAMISDDGTEADIAQISMRYKRFRDTHTLVE